MAIFGDIFDTVMVLIGFGVLIPLFFYLKTARSQDILENWAAQNGFKIINSEIRWLFQGPYTWYHFRGQTVFRVKVRDRVGQERLGWVCCGGFLVGVLSDDASVIWDNN
jgi:hypothetical protein